MLAESPRSPARRVAAATTGVRNGVRIRAVAAVGLFNLRTVRPAGDLRCGQLPANRGHVVSGQLTHAERRLDLSVATVRTPPAGASGSGLGGS
jgi:hypothetical protein